jgi:hypothetical protein
VPFESQAMPLLAHSLYSLINYIHSSTAPSSAPLIHLLRRRGIGFIKFIDSAIDFIIHSSTLFIHQLHSFINSAGEA